MPGYVFLLVFRFVSWGSNKNDLRHTVFSSIIGSFIIKTTFDILFDSFNEYFSRNPAPYSMLLFLFSVMFGYSLAILIRSDLWHYLSLRFNISRSPNTNVWNDIVKPGVWIKIYMKDGITTYLGQIVICEENNREPIIVLARYQLVNTKGEVILDYSDDDKEFIVLNMKDFEKAKLTVT